MAQSVSATPAGAANERRPFWSARVAETAVVFALALAVRVAFLVSSPDRAWPHSTLFEGDAPVWVRWATALATGQPFEFDLPMRSPGIAYLVHWLSPSPITAPFTGLKFAWCAIGAASSAVLFAVAHAAFGPRAAWLASLFLVFSFGSYQLASSLNGEGPYALLVVLSIGGTARFAARPGILLALALGVLHGAALAVRAEHALLLALFVAWTVLATLRDPDRRVAVWRGAAATLAAALVVVLPWTLRSHAAAQRFNTHESQPIDWAAATPPWSPEARAFFDRLPAFARAGNFAYAEHLARVSNKTRVELGDVERFFDVRFGYRPEPLAEWTLSSTKGPFDFALANHPRSDGGFTRAALEDGFDAAPQFAFARPSHLKLYNHGYQVGWGWIREDPKRWLALVEKKLGRFLGGATLGVTARDLPHGGDLVRRPVDLSVPAAPSRAFQVVFVILVLVGAALAFRTDVGALCLIVLGHKLLVTVLFYGYARQAASIEFVFALLAALALDRLLGRLLGRARVPERWATAGVAVVFVALLAVDLEAAIRPRRLEPRAIPGGASPVPAPMWGSGAFECVGPLEIRVR